jgi:SurA N-terminal domain
MRFSLLKFGVAVFLAVFAGRSFAGEIVDRLVASVDNTPILQSDWDQAVAFEAFEQARTVNSFTPEERRAVLDRLVDQQLLFSQMGDANTAAAEEREVVRQIAKIREAYPGVKSEEGWQQLLGEYRLNDETLRARVAKQIQVLRFIDLRLQPDSDVRPEDVEAYYTDTLVPAVRSRGAKVESLAELYPKIEEILRQQRLDELLNTWLHDLRDHSDIQWLAADASGASESDASTEPSGGGL